MDLLSNEVLNDSIKMTVGLINVGEDILDERFDVKASFKTVNDFIENYNLVGGFSGLKVDYLIVFLTDESLGRYNLDVAIKELNAIVRDEKLVLFTNHNDYYNLDKDLKVEVNKLERVIKLRKILEVI